MQIDKYTYKNMERRLEYTYNTNTKISFWQVHKYKRYPRGNLIDSLLK